MVHKYHLLLITVLLIAFYKTRSQNCPYSQFIQFCQKQIVTEYPIIKNPYQNPTQQYLQKVNENLRNKVRVCAIKYLNVQKSIYEQKTFQTKQIAINNSYIVTHQGVCGKCSTTKDLYVYLTTDLTRPVRKCGLKYFYSDQKMKACIKSLGFTDPCTQVWYWNTLNTKKQCLKECLWAYITKQPYIINGNLNKCLQCDEDKSGPIFKYESGRTRRNSGIKSQIDRPDDQIYKMDHCYY